MPDKFYEVKKLRHPVYAMRLRSVAFEDMVKIGQLPTPAIEEPEDVDEEEEVPESFIFFSAAEEPDHGALSPDTMIEFVYNSTKYTSLIQAFEVERITQLGRRKDLGGLFLRSTKPQQIRMLGARVVGDVENPRELWINILKALVTQHPKYVDILRATGTDTLVYANPKEARWGIGMAADDPLATEKGEWKGPNVLGQAWQAVRDSLPPEEKGEEEGAEAPQQGGGAHKYTEHGMTEGEVQGLRKNILRGYWKHRKHM
jgi:predicted NAD-dependent protein-ADP-ribosyltransferase YbiA (DUF1768 family)